MTHHPKKAGSENQVWGQARDPVDMVSEPPPPGTHDDTLCCDVRAYLPPTHLAPL